MAESTEISWTDSTYNPWIGCTNVSPACDHCYAEQQNSYRKWTEWGPHGERRRTKTSKQPREWQAGAAAFYREHGRRRRVFCASLADVFDNQAPAEWRRDLWQLIRDCPDLDWQLLTKRPQNIRKMLPDDWGIGYHNVWLGTSTENQQYYDQRWPHLAAIPAAVHFISYEPALGPLRLIPPVGVIGEPPRPAIYPSWAIIGGESGPNARVMPDLGEWVFALSQDCAKTGTALFHKQWGNYPTNPLVAKRGFSIERAQEVDPKTNGKGGALLNGVLLREFPAERFRNRTSTAL